MNQQLIDQWQTAQQESEVALIAWQTAPKLADGSYDWPLYYDWKTADAAFQRINMLYQTEMQRLRIRELELQIELRKVGGV